MGQIFSATDVPVGESGEVLAFNQVDLAVLDCRDLGEGFVVEKALPELGSTEFHGLGYDDDSRETWR